MKTLPSLCSSLVSTAVCAAFCLLSVSASSAAETNVFAYRTTPSIAQSAQPVSCLIVDGGYRQIGAVPAGDTRATPAEVDRLVRRAAQLSGFDPLKTGETPAIVLVYQWGYVNPDFVPTRTEDLGVLAHGKEALAIVGEGALANSDLNSERNTVLQAASEERYFLIVSAFDHQEYAKGKWTLLWRAHASVATPGLTEEKAMPVLAAASSKWLGRDSRTLRTVVVNETTRSHAEAVNVVDARR